MRHKLGGPYRSISHRPQVASRSEVASAVRDFMQQVVHQGGVRRVGAVGGSCVSDVRRKIRIEMKVLISLPIATLAVCLWAGNSTDASRHENDDQARACSIRPVQGIWEFGEDHEIVVQLEADGRGALKFVLAEYLFSWVAEGGNVIACSIDPDFGHGRRRCVLPVNMRSFVVRYLPDQNELELEPNGIFRGYFRGKRNLRFTSGEPHVDELIKKDEAWRRKEEKKMIALKDEHLKKWSRETVTNCCESFEMLLSVLSEDAGFRARSVAVKTEVEGLRDLFGCEKNFGQVLFTAELDVGYVEVGSRPKDLDLRAILSEARIPRPEELPPPDKVCEKGIKELVECWRNSGKSACVVSFLRIDGQWKECRDKVVLNWQLGQDRKVMQAMKMRFEGRFPCDVIISSVRPKAEQISLGK